MSKVQYDKIWSYIESGKAAGAKLALGGVKRPGKGYFVDPTSESLAHFRRTYSILTFLVVFTDISPDMKIVSHFCACALSQRLKAITGAGRDLWSRVVGG